MADITIQAANVGRVARLGQASYALAHDEADATNVQDQYHNCTIGQYESGTPTYSIYRGCLEFDLADFSGVTLTSAKMRLNITIDSSITDFDITIVDGSDLATEIIAADFGELLDETTSWGSLSTNGISTGWIEIAFNGTGLAALNAAIAGGVIRFGIRSSLDIADTPPTGWETVIYTGITVPMTNAPELVGSGDAPTVTTQSTSDILKTTATGNGNVTSLGSAAVTQHGHCWSTSADPTTNDAKTQNGAKGSTGAFTSSIIDLIKGTLYHCRAYAINAVGTSYGSDVTFTTNSEPTVTTQAVSSITTTTATGNGNITALGGANPTAHGVCYNTTGSPDINDGSVVTDEGGTSSTGAFTSGMVSLIPGQKYYVKAYATNSVGTGYGSEVNFTASKAPTVTTQTCRKAEDTTTTGRGNITDLGTESVTAHGHCWGETVNPTIDVDNKVDNGAAGSTGAFESAITGLVPGTGYFVRAFATSSVDTSYGANLFFVSSTDKAGYLWWEQSNLRGFDENAIEQAVLNKSDVDNTPVDAATDVPISSDWAEEHADVGAHGEIRLIPKATSAGPEGTMFYDSDDDHVYVATET